MAQDKSSCPNQSGDYLHYVGDWSGQNLLKSLRAWSANSSPHWYPHQVRVHVGGSVTKTPFFQAMIPVAKMRLLANTLYADPPCDPTPTVIGTKSLSLSTTAYIQGVARGHF